MKIGRFRRKFLLEVLILKKKNMQLPQTLRVRRSNLDVPTSNRIKALQRGNKITFALNGGVRANIGRFRRTFLLEVLILKKKNM